MNNLFSTFLLLPLILSYRLFLPFFNFKDDKLQLIKAFFKKFETIKMLKTLCFTIMIISEYSLLIN